MILAIILSLIAGTCLGIVIGQSQGAKKLKELERAHAHELVENNNAAYESGFYDALQPGDEMKKTYKRIWGTDYPN